MLNIGIRMQPYTDRHQSGFILLTTLIFMQCFASMTLAELMFIRLNLRASNHYFEKNILLSESKKMLNEIEENFALNPFCLKAIQSPQFLIEQPVVWWENHSCRITENTIHYFLIAEFLANNPCAFVEKTDENHYVTADYYRITLLTTRKNKMSKLILQSIIILPHFTAEICTGKLYQVKIGQQTWRELV